MEENQPTANARPARTRQYVIATSQPAHGNDVGEYHGWLSKPGRCFDPVLARRGERQFLPLLTDNNGDIIDEVGVYGHEDALDVIAVWGGVLYSVRMAVSLEQAYRSPDKGLGDDSGLSLGL